MPRTRGGPDLDRHGHRTAPFLALDAPAQLGSQLRDYVEERHDWRAVARRLSDALDRP